MTWLRSLSAFEYILIGSFILFYLLYIIRIILISRKMKSGIKPVFYKFLIRSGYFSLLIIALLGPSFGNVKKEIKSLSKDIYLVVDLSLSMNATDVEPSRIEKVKQSLKKINRSLTSDRIGIIIYTSTAHIQCPLTFDKEAVDLFIETLNPGLLSHGGTDLSTGLELAHEKFDKNDLNKIIIVFTDGEDFGNKSKDIVRKIEKSNIHFFMVGVGTLEGGKIPFNGKYKTDKEGKPVVSTLQRAALYELTEMGNGNYSEINQNSNDTEYLLKMINKIEGKITDAREIDASANKYFYFLLIALFLIFMDVLITVRTIKI
ncbi:MAG: VWA domain-containing protein [Cytophagaceae bacterium]|nr:VWA domain-containing protein [Cytophagaceae bacterium]